MFDDNQPSKGRRRFLKGTGVGLAAMLAGCSGGDGGDGGGATDTPEPDTPTPTPSGDGGDGGGTPTASDPLLRSRNVDLSGTKINWWNIANVNGQRIKRTIENFISDYEKDTGVSVEINHSGYEPLSGAQWIKNFRRGNYPPAAESEPTYLGRFYQGGWLLPYDEWKGGMRQENVEGLKWLKEGIYPSTTRGFREWAYDIPWGFTPRNGISVRKSHAEQAGQDPAKDWPPEDYDDLVDKATTLQENSDAQFGYQIFGAKFDYQDGMQPMALAQSVKNGTFLNKQWTDVNFKTDAWMNGMQQYVDLFRKHGLANDGTPTLSDEQARNLMLQGTVGASPVEWLNIPVLLERGKDVFTSDWRWQGFYPGETGSPYAMGFYSLFITRPPQGVDKQKWTRKQQAGIVLNDRWLAPNFNKKGITGLGLWGANQNSWEMQSVPGEESHHAKEEAFKAAENTEVGWETHPKFPSINFHVPGPKVNKMLQGQLDVDKGMKQIYQECQKLL